MVTATFDSNILRSLNDYTFKALIEAEQRHGVLRAVDPWTLIELLARLNDHESESYWPCRRAIRRSTWRSLSNGQRAPLILRPTEAELVTRLFDTQLHEVDRSVEEIVATCRFVAKAEDTDDLQSVAAIIAKLENHVVSKEKWFAQFLEDLSAQIHAAVSLSTTDVESARSQIRNFLRSDQMLRLDAHALVARAYAQAGEELPEPIPEHHLRLAQSLNHAGSTVVALALERILCDGMKVRKSQAINLIWDQEIASSVGREVAGHRVVVITDDSFFATAAIVGKFDDFVRTKVQYLTQIGVLDGP